MSEILSTQRSQSASSFSLPEGWLLLPTREVDAGEWVEEYLDALPVQPTALTRSQLRYALLAVIELTARMPEGARHSFALVGDPLDGVVRALLTMQKFHVTPDAYDNLLARMQNPADSEEVETINREVQQFALPAGRALVMHDFILETSVESVPDPATERTTLALFVDGTDTMLDFAMYAQDLAAFTDMPAYLLDIVAPLDHTGVSL